MGRRADRIDEMTLEVLVGIEEDEDPRHAYAAVRRRIEDIRKAGEDIPDALVTAEQRLMAECIAASQGR